MEKFLSLKNLDTLIRIPNSYSSVDDTGEADLAFCCAFVNMADIPDIDCFECEDVAVGMGVVAMKYAFDGEKLVKVLPNFKDALIQMQ